MPRFTHRKVIPIGATARVVAQRAPETLTLVRHRTQSTAETIARLSVTAVLAYLAAACDQQDRLGELMRADPAAGQATWPLRGELISQPDRLGHELGEGKPERSPRRLRRSWRCGCARPALRRAAARIARMGSARVADPAGAARVLTGPPCPAGTVGSPGRGGAPGVSPGRSWQRGTEAGTR